MIYPLTALCAAMFAAEHTLKTLRDRGTQHELLPQMQTRADLYELLDYHDWEAHDRDLLGQPPGSDQPPA